MQREHTSKQLRHRGGVEHHAAQSRVAWHAAGDQVARLPACIPQVRREVHRRAEVRLLGTLQLRTSTVEFRGRLDAVDACRVTSAYTTRDRVEAHVGQAHTIADHLQLQRRREPLRIRLRGLEEQLVRHGDALRLRHYAQCACHT